MSVIQLLHGTDHIIEVPDIHIGNPHNDYGMGFYCTRVDEMAREWACKKNADGFVNSYDFDTEGLKVLNLLDGMHTVLNWMALLLQFRTFKLDSEVAVDARDYLIGHYSIDLTGYDVVIGYRADDSYFQYAESFVSNTLPLRSLNRALKLGKLGEQTVVISQKGFDRLHFVNKPAFRTMFDNSGEMIPPCGVPFSGKPIPATSAFSMAEMIDSSFLSLIPSVHICFSSFPWFTLSKKDLISISMT